VRVLGVDFTSQPHRAKPLTVAEGRLDGPRLTIETVRELTTFAAYEELLREPGPWVAAVDHPFGLPAQFVAQVGWPQTWGALVAHVAGMDRAVFREAVADFLAGRPSGRRYLRRRVEQRVRMAQSPLNLVRPPVGLMFFEGAPRLLASGARVLPSHPEGDPGRVVVEGFPGLVVRELIGTRPYKDAGWRAGRARQAALDQLAEGLMPTYGLEIAFDEPWRTNALLDAGGDLLDAVLCAVQAGWAAQRSDEGYGVSAGADRLEGWIVDPLTD
jgi:hypothetical protein